MAVILKFIWFHVANYLTKGTHVAINVLEDSPGAASSITLLLNNNWQSQVRQQMRFLHNATWPDDDIVISVDALGLEARYCDSALKLNPCFTQTGKFLHSCGINKVDHCFHIMSFHFDPLI